MLDTLRFTECRILLYRLFDVADEIDLERVESLLAGAGKRLRLVRDRSEFIQIQRAPLSVSLGAREVTGSSGQVFLAEAHARIFNFGAISIRYEILLPDGSDHGRIAALVREFETARTVEDSARDESQKLRDRILPALDNVHRWDGVETYAVVFARGIEPGSGSPAWKNDPRIARILLAETGPETLSPDEVKDATQFQFSYAEGDLCVIDWNTAVVVEPTLALDIPDVLEFATAQLLEFRYYDEMVDRELEGLYDRLTKPREPFLWKLGGRYRRLGRKLNLRLLETLEFVERVDNSLKVIADTYLARVYQAALQSFRVPAWLEQVNRKQDLTRQVAEVLSGESQATTSNFLELVIILLIAYEIVAPLLKGVLGA